jgi:hypothetical protein
VEFEQAAREAAQAGQRDRETFAKEQYKQLESLLSFVTLKFDGPPDVVMIDGKDASVAGAIPLDPGPHEFRFAAPGRIAKTVRFEVANGPSKQTLEAPHLDPEPPLTPPVVPPPHPPKRDDPRRVAAIAAAGADGLALVLGTYFGFHAAAKKSDAEPHCNGKYCDPEGLSLEDDAHSAATVSTIAFGVGILALGAAAYLYFTSQRSSHAVAFRVAPALNGARLEARW